jgi:hypothetical protein
MIQIQSTSGSDVVLTVTLTDDGGPVNLTGRSVAVFDTPDQLLGLVSAAITNAAAGVIKMITYGLGTYAGVMTIVSSDPEAVADAVRVELATELGRIDVATSTRLASASYTAPANSDVAAIKAKTDGLPADPASNTQVNTRLAAASYVAPANDDITSIKAKTDNLPASPATEQTTEAAKNAAVAAANLSAAAL